MKKIIAFQSPLRRISDENSLPTACGIPVNEVDRKEIWSAGPVLENEAKIIRRSNDLYIFISDQYVIFLKTVSNPVQEKFLNDIGRLFGFETPISLLIPKNSVEGKMIEGKIREEDDLLRSLLIECKSLNLESSYIATGLLQGCSGERLTKSHFQDFSVEKQRNLFYQIGRATSFDILTNNYDRFGLEATIHTMLQLRSRHSGSLVRNPNHGNWLYDPETGNIRLLDSAIGMNTINLDELTLRIGTIQDPVRASKYFKDMLGFLPEILRNSQTISDREAIDNIRRGALDGFAGIALADHESILTIVDEVAFAQVETDSIIQSNFFNALEILRAIFTPKSTSSSQNSCVIL